MKTSIIFITLLFAVSCKIDSSEQTTFIQLSKDPRAEAVLATVAIQMQQNNGFEKVQALLNELLNSARENLHHNNMLFRKAQGRCDIYNHKLSEKDEYLSSLLDSLSSEKITLVDAETKAGDAITARTELIKVYQALQKGEVERFQNENLFYQSIENTINDAQNAINDLVRQLKSADQPSASFLQTNIKKVTDAYQKVFNVNVNMPTAFLQISFDNAAAKGKILSWLDDIRMTFSGMVSNVKDDSAARQKNSQEFNSLIKTIVEALQNENVNITGLKEKYTTLIADYEKNIKDFSDFKTKNQENLTENQTYCSNEQKNYEKVKAGSESNVQIYEELLGYFLENYRKISRMINEKYKNLQ